MPAFFTNHQTFRDLALFALIMSSIFAEARTAAFANDNDDNIRQLLRAHGDAWDSPAKSNGVPIESTRPAVPSQDFVRPGRSESWRAIPREGGPRHHWVVAHQRPSGRSLAPSPPPEPPVRSAAVSIYDDRTLRRGDAVMTSRGLRIFEGSGTFPYRPSDFRPLDAATGVTRSLRKSLSLYDHQIPLPQEFAGAPEMTIHLDPGNSAKDAVAGTASSPQTPFQDGEGPRGKTAKAENKD